LKALVTDSTVVSSISAAPSEHLPTCPDVAGKYYLFGSGSLTAGFAAA